MWKPELPAKAISLWQPSPEQWLSQDLLQFIAKPKGHAVLDHFYPSNGSLAVKANFPKRARDSLPESQSEVGASNAERHCYEVQKDQRQRWTYPWQGQTVVFVV